MRKGVNINNDGLFDDRYYKCVKEAGLDGCDIDLTSSDPSFMSDENWEGQAYKIKERLDANGLDCIQVHLPCHDIFKSSEIIDENVKMATLNSLKAMKILGCKWGAYHPRTSFVNGFDSDASIRDNIREISIYLEEAEKLGVGIAVENIPIFPDCPQHTFFSADYDELNFLVESFKSDKVGICWDFGHANLMAFRQEKAFEILGDKIRMVHMANNYKFNDDHNIPTFGYADWKNIMPALYKCGYSGDFTLEVHYPYDDAGLTSFFKHGLDSLLMLESYFK